MWGGVKSCAPITEFLQLVDGNGGRLHYLKGILPSTLLYNFYLKECLKILDQDALLVMITFQEV